MAHCDDDVYDMDIMAGIFDEAQHHAFALILVNNYYGFWYELLSRLRYPLMPFFTKRTSRWQCVIIIYSVCILYSKRGQPSSIQQPFSPRPSHDKPEAEKDSRSKSSSLRAGGASSPSRQPEQMGSPRRVSSLRSHWPSPSQAMRALSPRSAKAGKDDSPVTVVKKLTTCDDNEAGTPAVPEQVMFESTLTF